MAGKKVVIIGAVALGPKVACRLKRLQPDAQVTLIDQDQYISYDRCGMPYFISGDVSEVRQLLSTTYHMVRTPEFFENTKGVHVRTRTRALAVDRQAKCVKVRQLESGKEEDLPYDELVLATGSRPNGLSLPGAYHSCVVSLARLQAAIAIRERIARGEVGKAVIIGAGAIGCQMAEALSDLWGTETSVVETADQVLPTILDADLARMVQKHMRDKGIAIFLGETVLQIRPDGGAAMVRVITSQRSLEADLVIAAVGVQPHSELARHAGLLVSPGGGIVVNHRLQTSDPNIYAGGDCIETMHLVTGKPTYFPQGSLANRQGRVIGTNLAGGFASFKGVVGSFAVKVFDLAVASTGISLQTALREGFDAVQALIIQADRAHFYPEQDFIYFQLIVDRKTRRLLGAQGVARNGHALLGRINSITAMLPWGATLDDLSNLEVAYSPPFASALDVVNAAANTVENILDGYNRPLDMAEFEKAFLRGPAEGAICLDVRGPANAAPYVARFGERWLNIPQETLNQRFQEVPDGRPLIVVCNSGHRSYEAQRQLDHAGLWETLNLQGGVAALKKAGLLDPLSEE